ncbi:MAG TPA: metallophosphoesterase [Porphyromonadaceae bacterium]|nr:metallophosphoesterase [Porphyromonadaceae bacterium]
MKAFYLLLLLQLTLFPAGCNAVAADSLRIALISDLHYLSPTLYDRGEALTSYEERSGRQFEQQQRVLDQLWADLLKEKPDLLLISGDLTHHGERQSHLDLVARLQSLEREGIRVVVVPGNHDINIPNAFAYRGEKPTPVESITKDAFAQLYDPFGYGEALVRDEASLSYLISLDEQHWLLCFDSNRYEEHTTGSITAGHIKPQTLEWALSLLRDADERGITVLGMMHHGLVEHMPYQSAFFPGYLVDEWERHAELLADAGMPLIFTGHFHSNDITRFTSAAGNKIDDIETASLAQYPYAWRMMTLEEGSLAVESHFVTSLPGNADLEQEAMDRLEVATRRVAESRLKGLGFPIPDELMPLLTDLIVKLNLKHVKGDEKADPEMMLSLRMFASYLGDEVDLQNFSFDFPPTDNNVEIKWETKGRE